MRVRDYSLSSKYNLPSDSIELIGHNAKVYICLWSPQGWYWHNIVLFYLDIQMSIFLVGYHQNSMYLDPCLGIVIELSYDFGLSKK